MKKDKIKFLILVLTINVIWSCNISKNALEKTKQGSYTISVKPVTSEKAIVFGAIYDYDSKTALRFPRVQANDDILSSADENGKYKVYLKPGRYRFTGKGLPYQFVKTKTIAVKAGEIIKINFYLKPYDKPLQ